ncbi:ankyrin repeat-containing domain protein [Penicillium chermesinum]|uniref:Ankyrin repeat-containing domain protein n=1 Tax=Penicillium chermesinum TaxID=63820 RepID=A0A9W9PHH8_9EURO|nr:ankyrin repeat-containing domain protein [Penicillium chermesinum]KAJ5246840.1 ankyrin repeat-containing domain protein [Penicillium chermesinum]
MNLQEQLQADPLERRRLQNRLAQRKFREKKRREADEILTGSDLSHNGSSQMSRGSGASKESSDGVELGDIGVTMNTFDQFLSDEHPAPYLPGTAGLGYSSEGVAPLDPMAWSETNRLSSHNLPQTNDEQGLLGALQRRNSDSDLRTDTPNKNPPLFHYDDLSGILTKSKKNGWLGSLHIAAARGNEKVLRVLLLSGNVDINQQDSDKRTPLIYAAMEGRESVLRLLLAHGARIGVSDCDNRSSIHWAVLRRDRKMLQLLLDHRAEHEPDLDIDTHDSHGWTALHMAIDRDFEDGMLLLLNLGADMNAKAGKCPNVSRVVAYLDWKKKI